MEVFYEVGGVPTNSCILLSTHDEAVNYPRGEIRLAFCPGCGFISNVAYDARLTEYSGRYEETQGFSPTFNSFHERLARSLVERHDLHGKELIEIGCGKGEFLKLLCDLGGNRGLGFDPGYSVQRGEELGASRFDRLSGRNYTSSRIRVGSSTQSLMRFRNVTASRPSIRRWS
jgi:hypothetical protein